MRFLVENGFLGFVILGSVFLAVTGAEALYADMGHFGEGPIQRRLAVPGLPLPGPELPRPGRAGAGPPGRRGTTRSGTWCPTFAYWPVLVMATVRHRHRQPGGDHRRLLGDPAGGAAGPAAAHRHQAHLRDPGRPDLRAAGQHLPDDRRAGAAGRCSRARTALASAYGIAVTGAMFVDTLLAYVVHAPAVEVEPVADAAAAGRRWRCIDLVFIASNLLKIPDGAWLPLVFGAVLVLIMWTWTRGAQILTDKTRRDSVPLDDLMEILQARAPHRAPGTAIFLTSDPDMTPVALMHNLKHNKVLHETQRGR